MPTSRHNEDSIREWENPARDYGENDKIVTRERALCHTYYCVVIVNVNDDG